MEAAASLHAPPPASNGLHPQHNTHHLEQQQQQQYHQRTSQQHQQAGNGSMAPLPPAAGGIAASVTPHEDATAAPRAPRMEMPLELQLYVQEELSRAVKSVEERVGGALDGVAEELAAELGREQQHLMLMQSQVDKTATQLARELADFNKRMEQEKTQRSYLHSMVRESREDMQRAMRSQAAEIQRLQRTVEDLNTPWLFRFWSSFMTALTCCRPPSLEGVRYPARAIEYAMTAVPSSLAGPAGGGAGGGHSGGEAELRTPLRGSGGSGGSLSSGAGGGGGSPDLLPGLTAALREPQAQPPLELAPQAPASPPARAGNGTARAGTGPGVALPPPLLIPIEDASDTALPSIVSAALATPAPKQQQRAASGPPSFEAIQEESVTTPTGSESVRSPTAGSTASLL